MSKTKIAGIEIKIKEYRKTIVKKIKLIIIDLCCAQEDKISNLKSNPALNECNILMEHSICAERSWKKPFDHSVLMSEYLEKVKENTKKLLKFSIRGP